MASSQNSPETHAEDGLAAVLEPGLFGPLAQERFDLLRKKLLDDKGQPIDMAAVEQITSRFKSNDLPLGEAIKAYNHATDSRRWPIFAVRANGDRERLEDRLMGMGFELVPFLAIAYRKRGLTPLRLPPEPLFLEALAKRPDISRIERAWLPVTVPESAPEPSHQLTYPDELIDPKGLPPELFTARDPVSIGLLDSGIDARHQILQMRLIDQRTFRKGEERVGDRFGHGTAVSGTIVKICPCAHFISAKTLNPSGHGNLDDVIRALSWIVEKRPDFILCNISIDIPSQNTAILSRLLNDLADQGTLVIVPTSTLAGVLNPPADAPNVITVAPDSSTHTTATLMARAAGLRVPRSIQADKERFPILQPSGWTALQSPALAAALVASTAALLIRLARLQRRTPSATEIKEALLSGSPNRRLDIMRALHLYHGKLPQLIQADLDKPTATTPSTSSTSEQRIPPQRTPTPRDVVEPSDDELPTLHIPAHHIRTGVHFAIPEQKPKTKDAWDETSSADEDLPTQIQGGWADPKK